MNISSSGKCIITKQNVFAEKLLKQKARPLWDQHKTYTKAERDAALAWLAKGLKADITTRAMLTVVLRFKRMQEKRLRGYLLQCIRQKLPPEVTMYLTRVPIWMRNLEAKLQMLPRLIEECRITGFLKEDRTEEMWKKIVQLLLVECHEHQRIPTLEDVQTVATRTMVNNYQLLYRLWTRQKESAIYKFRSLHEAGDVVRDVSLALTQQEWKVVDAITLYAKEFPLVSINSSNKIQPLITLYQIVVAYKVDENNEFEQQDKWAKVVQEYSKKYVTSPSGLILQRKWWELKQQVHDNIRERLRTVGYRVHPLLVEIAAKYPNIIRETPEDWQDTVKSGKVYDVSDIQVDYDSSDDDDSDEDDATTCKSSRGCVVDLDSEYDSEDDKPLIIDEDKTKKNASQSMPDPNKKDKETPEIKSTDAENVPVIPKIDMSPDVNATNTNVNANIVEHTRNREINMLNTELDCQLNCVTENKTDSAETLMGINENSSKDNMNENTTSNLTCNVIKTDNLMPANDINSEESNNDFRKHSIMITSNEVRKSNDNLSNVTVSDTSNSQDNITTTDGTTLKNITGTTTTNDSLITNNVTNPAASKIKTYSKVKPVRDLLADSVKVIESELQKLELEFQIQMRNMMIVGRAEANADKRKQTIKKGDDKGLHDSDPLNVGTAKVNKTYSSKRNIDKSSSTKKKGVQKYPIKETKANSVSSKTKTTDSSKMDDDKLNATNVNIDECNIAANSLIEGEGIDTHAKTISEIANDEPKSIIATVYTCKGPDGKDLGHVILPTPISKDAVTVSIKTDNGTLSIDSAVVNDIPRPLNEPIKPLCKTIQPLKEIIPLNEPLDKIIQPNESIRSLNKSKESDLDLLQKIDPAQTQTMIIFSDSEDESENVPINNKGQENVPMIINTKQENDPNIAVQKKDYINLNDVKKYLNNHSLDDILAKMGDMVVKKEAKNIEKDSVNRICESFIYVSDSDEDDTKNKEKLVELNDDSINNDNIEVTDVKVTNIENNLDQDLKMISCRSNDCTMINDTIERKPEDTIVQADDVLNVPNTNVFILPPEFFCTSKTLVSSTNMTSSTPDVLIPPSIQGPSPNILIPPNVMSPIVQTELPNVLLPTSMVSQPTPNVLLPTSLNVTGRVQTPTQTVPNLTSNVVIPATSIFNSQTVSSSIPNTTMVLSRTPNVTNPTSNATTTPIPTPDIECSTSNVKIPTPNSNVVTMIINDAIGKYFNEDDHKTDEFKNVFDDVISADSEFTVNKNKNANSYKNKSSDKKQRRTKIYNETAGYSGLFKLKDRSTKETVGMLCRIKEEKSLVNEVTEKIDNYLETFKDNDNNSEIRSETRSETRSELYHIINKKLEIESKKRSKDGFLKMMLENCQAKTLWTSGEKDKSDEGGSDEGKSDEESDVEKIDPKLIMDARVYLPKLDEIETYNKNRRVNFSINTKRISKLGYKILNYKMKSDDPVLVIDNTESLASVPIAEHIETEIAEALKNKIPGEESKRNASEDNENEKSRKRAISDVKSKTKPKDRPGMKLVDLRTEQLENLTRQIKKEREIQQYINRNRNIEQGGQNVTERINILASKIINERQKQQLVDVNTTNIVQRIKFESDEDFDLNNTRMDEKIPESNEENTNSSDSNDTNDKNIVDEDSELQSVLQETIQAINDKNKEYDDDKYDSEDMELDTVNDNTLILDSSNLLINRQDKETNVVGNESYITENREAKSTNEEINKNTNSKSIVDENVISTDVDPHKRLSISVKVETMDTETLNMSYDLTSDDEIIPMKRRRKLINSIISSEEEDNEETSLQKPRQVKKRKIISDENEERCSKSDEELGLMIESELLKEDSAKELLQTENELLKEIRHSDDVLVKKSNIEEMLKLCKPVKLCLERVQVPKDSDLQVRKVELPDRASLKRHRAPTAHVAPIRAGTAGSDDEGLPEVTVEGDATEAEIGNLLQQLTKETRFEWHRLEESVKPKRTRVDADHSYSKREKKNESEHNNDKNTERKRKKKDEKKQQPQKDSDDEIDANLEWQRQKNINYKFFNFNPINNSMEPDPNNTRRDKKNQKPNKKLDILVRKAVVEDNRMQPTEFINLDDDTEENNDKTSQNETQAAVESIIKDNTILVLNQNKKIETIPLAAKGAKPLKIVSKDIQLTPIFTKVEPKFVKSDDWLKPKAPEVSNELVPIATKVEPIRQEPEKEEPSKLSIVKKYYSMKFRNFVQKLPKKQNVSKTIDSQPSTSKENFIQSKEPIPSTSKASLNPDSICISDDSNDIFELTQTISVKNNESNDKENCKKSVSLQDLMREHNINKQIASPTIVRGPQPIIKLIPATKASSPNPAIERPKIPNASITNPPVKVYDNIQIRSKNANPAVKIMEIGPIRSDDSCLELVVNETSLDDDNNDSENGPQITNVTSIPSTVDFDDNASNYKEQIKNNQPESTLRIENVMSLQSFAPKVFENLNKPSNNLVEEKTVRGLGLAVHNVRSLPTNIDLDHDKIELNEPPNSNDEHYDSDSDNLQIDESFSSNIYTTTILKFDYGRARNKNIDEPKINPTTMRGNVSLTIPTKKHVDDEIIQSREIDSDDRIGEISKIDSVTSEPSIFEDDIKPSYSTEKESSNGEKDLTINHTERSEFSSNKDNSKIIDIKMEGSYTDISTKDPKTVENLENINIGKDNAKTDDDKMEVDESGDTKIDREESLDLYTEERLLESPIPYDEQDNSTNVKRCKTSKENDSSDLSSDNKQDDSDNITNTIDNPTENSSKCENNAQPSTCEENPNPNVMENSKVKDSTDIRSDSKQDNSNTVTNEIENPSENSSKSEENEQPSTIEKKSKPNDLENSRVNNSTDIRSDYKQDNSNTVTNEIENPSENSSKSEENEQTSTTEEKSNPNDIEISKINNSTDIRSDNKQDNSNTVTNEIENPSENSSKSKGNKQPSTTEEKSNPNNIENSKINNSTDIKSDNKQDNSNTVTNEIENPTENSSKSEGNEQPSTTEEKSNPNDIENSKVNKSTDIRFDNKQDNSNTITNKIGNPTERISKSEEIALPSTSEEKSKPNDLQNSKLNDSTDINSDKKQDTSDKITKTTENSSKCEVNAQPSTSKENSNPNDMENSKVKDFTDLSFNNKQNTSDKEENSFGNTSKSEENAQPSTSKENPKPNEKENEPKLEKPKTFLKLVPIQKLRGEPITKDVTEDDKEVDAVKLRGQAMPFQCLTDDEGTMSAASDDDISNMPVISNVVSLSSIKEEAPKGQPSRSILRVKINKSDVVGHSQVWNPGRIDVPPAHVLTRLDFSKVSPAPPVAIADFIKDRDCTNISLLCIDEWRPLWMIHGEYFVLTNLKLHVIGPTYWTVGAPAQCTRIIMDDKSSGSTIVGALSVPDEVFLDNNWYKKLSTDPMIYAKIWFVVPDVTTCKEMLSCNVQMQLFSRVTGAILPLAVLNQKTTPKPAHYRINTQHLDSVQLPEKATLINTTVTMNKLGQVVVSGQFSKDVLQKPVTKTVTKPATKPVTSDEVISLDSDDE